MEHDEDDDDDDDDDGDNDYQYWSYIHKDLTSIQDFIYRVGLEHDDDDDDNYIQKISPAYRISSMKHDVDDDNDKM